MAKIDEDAIAKLKALFQDNEKALGSNFSQLIYFFNDNKVTDNGDGTFSVGNTIINVNDIVQEPEIRSLILSQLKDSTDLAIKSDVTTAISAATASKADDSKVVHTTDMRKPASDVAGIEEVNAKQDKIGYSPADDSKVVHDTGNESINGIKTFIDGIGSISIDSTNASTRLPNNSLTDLANGYDSNYQYFITGVQPVDAPYSSILYGMIEVKQYSANNKWILFYDNVKKCIFYKSTTGGEWGSWIQFADDSTVAHLSGANNFDTVPMVKNNPLLLASSLPSDLARTGSDQEFTGKNTFDTAPIDKATGSPYITKSDLPSDNNTVVKVVTQAQYDALTDKTGLYVIQG